MSVNQIFVIFNNTRFPIYLVLQINFWYVWSWLKIWLDQQACEIRFKKSFFQMASNINMKSSQLGQPVHHRKTLRPCMGCSNWLKICFIDGIWISQRSKELGNHINIEISFFKDIIKWVKKSCYRIKESLLIRLKCCRS